MIRLISILLLATFSQILFAADEKQPGEDEKAVHNQLLNAPSKSAALNEDDQSYLLRHNPFYFAYGNPISKLQLGFRTKIVRGVPLYFAYTQQMFWALQQTSKPFRDLTYNPEFFYRFNFENAGLLQSIDTGWAHTSNGKGGDESRSFNELYGRINFEKEFRRWILRASFKASYLHAFDETNPDIQDYVGPFSLKLSWIQLYDAWIDKSEFSVTATAGGKFSQNLQRGGYQFAWAFRLGGIDFLPSFYLQYYTGYAETLLNYNQYVHAFRGGFIF